MKIISMKFPFFFLFLLVSLSHSLEWSVQTSEVNELTNFKK